MRMVMGVSFASNGWLLAYFWRVGKLVGLPSALRHTRNHFGWDRLRFDRRGIVRAAAHPDPRFGAFGGQRAGKRQAVFNLEACAPAGHDGALDRHLVAEARRQTELRARFENRMADKIIGLEILDLLHAGGAFVKGRGRGVEYLEITREIDDPGRIAVAPFDAGGTDVFQHGVFGVTLPVSAAPCAERRRSAPPRH